MKEFKAMVDAVKVTQGGSKLYTLFVSKELYKPHKTFNISQLDQNVCLNC